MKLNQITIPVLSLSKSISFYEKMGLRLIVKSAEYARFLVEENNTTFSLHKVHALAEGERTWIYFEVQNPDATTQSLIEKGFLFESLPEDKPWLWRESRLRDPDNHLIIIYYAGENRINPPWKIQ